MLVTGIKKSNETITLYTIYKVISFDLYPSDTPQHIIYELVQEGFKIANLNYLEKLLKIVLYTRFKSIIQVEFCHKSL